MLPEEIVRDAAFSPDGRCRWTLSRTWERKKGLVLFTGLNPSRAGAEIDDMTVTKGMGFADKWNFGGTLHGNAYPFIATNPADLVRCTPQEIAENDRRLLEMARQASLVVVMWGSFPKFRERFDQVAELLAPWNPICLGRTKDGFPKHISRIAYASPREPWLRTA